MARETRLHDRVAIFSASSQQRRVIVFSVSFVILLGALRRSGRVSRRRWSSLSIVAAIDWCYRWRRDRISLNACSGRAHNGASCIPHLKLHFLYSLESCKKKTRFVPFLNTYILPPQHHSISLRVLSRKCNCMSQAHYCTAKSEIIGRLLAHSETTGRITPFEIEKERNCLLQLSRYSARAFNEHP